MIIFRKIGLPILAVISLAGCPVSNQSSPNNSIVGRYHWITTDPDVLSVSGADLTISPEEKFSWVMVDEAFSYPYSFSFRESRTSGNGDLTLLWNYYLMGASFPKSFSTGFNQKLVIHDNGSAEYWPNAFGSQTISTSTPGERSWKVVCESTNISIYLNNILIKSVAADNPTNIIPSVAFQINGRGNSPADFILRDFLVTDSGSVGAKKPVVSQYTIPGRTAPDMMTIISSTPLSGTMQSFLAEMPGILQDLEIEAGLTVWHTDIVIALYEGAVSAGYNLGAFPYYAGWLVIPSQFEGNYFPMTHEVAHYYRAVGANGGSQNVGDNWFLEGFANYMALRALNRYWNRPQWDFSLSQARIKTNMVVRGAWDPPLNLGTNITTPFVPAGQTPADVSKDAAYGKGYMFLFLVSRVFGHQHIQNIIAQNESLYIDNSGYTPQMLTEDLRTETSNAIDPYIPGWLTDTNYTSWTPQDFLDTDQDGVIGLVEGLAGTDPDNWDSDGDLQSDYEELLYGTDPTNSISQTVNKPWKIDGFPFDFDETGAAVVTNTVSGGSAGEWERFAVKHNSTKIDGALTDYDYTNAEAQVNQITLEIQDSSAHKLRAIWVDGTLFSLEWLNSYNGPALLFSDFTGAQTVHGFEFRVPGWILDPGQLNFTVYRWRSTSFSYMQASL